MSWFFKLDLLSFFAFYLSLIFVVSTALRIQQYMTVLKLVRAVPERWPRLFGLLTEHRTIFLTWSTFLPVLIALGLCVVHSLACWTIWPQAKLSPCTLAEHWPALFFIVPLGVGMIGFDVFGTWNVGEIDRAMMEKYFDQAEYWLKSWTAPAVRMLTFGYIDPRKIVNVEVGKALIEVSAMLNTTLWWFAIQAGLRIAFGLSLWLTYAFGG